MAWRLPLYIFIMGQSRFSLKITAIAAKRRPGRGACVRDWGGGRRTSATPPSMPLGLESRRGLLWLRAQCGLGERVEQLDCSAGDAEDLTTATSQCNPRFERRDTLSAEALNQRLRQVMWQCMRHAGQFSQSVGFAKRNLTLMPLNMLIQRCASHNGGRQRRGVGRLKPREPAWHVPPSAPSSSAG